MLYICPSILRGHKQLGSRDKSIDGLAMLPTLNTFQAMLLQMYNTRLKYMDS